MLRVSIAIALLGLTSTVAHAHFKLVAPPAYSVQDEYGSPQKSAPCGQADPSQPMEATDQVSTYHAGDMVTITVDETIAHPGHYRVALASEPSGLPADPAVTAGSTACGTAVIQDSSTPGVLVDNQLEHTSRFSGPQTFQVQLPAGMTCDHCTLQVLEFMSNHGLNNPGGCFYHHCATINVVAAGEDIPDAGMTTPPVTEPVDDGGCATGAPTGALAGVGIAIGALVIRRRRRA